MKGCASAKHWRTCVMSGGRSKSHHGEPGLWMPIGAMPLE